MRRSLLAVVALIAGCTGSEATQPSPYTPLPVGSITIEAPVTLKVADSVRVGISLRDIADHVISNRPVSFSSSAPDIASIDSSGLVLAHAEGAVTIIARSEGVSDQKTLTILPRIGCSGQPLDCVPGPERFVLVLVDGQPLPVRSPWGIGEWDYDSDAGTWQLVDAAITLFPDETFTYATSHRAASGATITDTSRGSYVRGLSSVEFSVVGNKWSADITARGLIERWPGGRTLTFEGVR